MAANILVTFIVLLQPFALSLGTFNPPPDTPSRCANARRPDNGHVKCCIELSSFDDVENNSGGKSGSSGGKSSGGSSKGPDHYTCTYTCDPGFQLNGPPVLECPIDKITDNPTCEPIVCDVLPTIDHGYLNCSNSFEYGSICQYNCATGFNITGGSKKLSCNINGMWDGIIPTCQPVQCPPLHEPSHGSLSCPNGRTYGTDCRYTCDDRYTLDGPPVVSCYANGQWGSAENQLPTCKLSECRPLPQLIHGSISCTRGFDRGSVCSHSCHGGYTLTGGNYLLSCRYNGFWRGDIPTCEEDTVIDWVRIVTPIPTNSTNNTLCYCDTPPPGSNEIPDFPQPSGEDGPSPPTTRFPTTHQPNVTYPDFNTTTVSGNQTIPSRNYSTTPPTYYTTDGFETTPSRNYSTTPPRYYTTDGFETTPSRNYSTTPPRYKTTTKSPPANTTTVLTGNSTATEFDFYDFTDGRPADGPSPIVDGGGNSGGNAPSGGLGTASIIAILAVAIIVIFVAAGLFIAYRSKRPAQAGYGNL